MALLADLLTGARAVMAFGLVASLAGERLTTAGLLLSGAWLTDVFDGRLARSGTASTRLGGRDLDVDTLVGAGVLVGLQLGDVAPLWITWGALLLLGVPYLILKHPTLSLSLQAVAYALFLSLLWSEAGAVRWLPPLTILFILVLDFERFRTITLPGFFSGFLELLPERGGKGR